MGRPFKFQTANLEHAESGIVPYTSSAQGFEEKREVRRFEKKKNRRVGEEGERVLWSNMHLFRRGEVEQTRAKEEPTWSSSLHISLFPPEGLE